jgi:DNA-binding LytR/AlgR family response regulator
LSYGGVTTFVVFVLNSNLNYLFSDYFCEEKWTVGREILWTIINISLIGIVNAVLTSYLANISLSLKLILIFQLYTVLLALVPIVFVITYNEAVHNKKYTELSKDINSHLTTHSVAAKQVTIPSYNENEELEIGADDLVYITSADNYIEVYYKTTGENINKKLLRSTLKNTEAIFEDFQNIIRCHKSYIVNLNFVKNVTGNAQGYKLHLENSDIKIPVSRKLNDFVKEKLTT